MISQSVRGYESEMNIVSATICTFVLLFDVLVMIS